MGRKGSENVQNCVMSLMDDPLDDYYHLQQLRFTITKLIRTTMLINMSQSNYIFG